MPTRVDDPEQRLAGRREWTIDSIPANSNGVRIALGCRNWPGEVSAELYFGTQLAASCTFVKDHVDKETMLPTPWRTWSVTWGEKLNRARTAYTKLRYSDARLVLNLPGPADVSVRIESF